MSDEEEEPGELEDDKNWDPYYNPFFDEPLFGDPRKTHKEAAGGPSVKKEESVASNTEEKPFEEIGQPFEEVNEDYGFVEGNWYEPRGTDSLRYHYSEEDVQYILKKRAEKWTAMGEKEIIDLTGDSD